MEGIRWTKNKLRKYNIGETEDVEEMAKNFTEIMIGALDEHAPVTKLKGYGIDMKFLYSVWVNP